MGKDVLIERAQRGDRAAAEELCSEHWRAVYRLVYARVGNRQEAEDLTQEAFARFWRALPRFQGSDVGPYLRTIALNLLRNHLRDHARHPEVELGDLDSRAPSAEHEVFALWQQDEVRRLLDELGGDQANVLRLRLIEALSVGEAGERMGKSPEAIRSLQYRALQELRRRLATSSAEWKGGL